MEQYPQDLFSVVAQRILSKYRGETSAATLQKEAWDKSLNKAITHLNKASSLIRKVGV